MPRGTVNAKGQKIQELRSQRGLTQEKLARLTGYSKRTIERLESGGSTTAFTLSNVAEGLRFRARSDSRFGDAAMVMRAG